MREKLIEMLNCNKSLKEKVVLSLESFVEYYGEENRNSIENFFQNTLFLAYQSPSAYESCLNKIKLLKAEELIGKAISKNQTPVTREELYGSTSVSDLTSNSLPINLLAEFFYQTSIGKTKREEIFLTKTYNELKGYFQNASYEEFLDIIEKKELPEMYSNIPTWVKSNISFCSKKKNRDLEYKRLFSKVEKIILKIDSSVTLQNFEEKFNTPSFDSIKALIEEHERNITEFNSSKNELEPYYKQVKRNNLLRGELSKQFYIEYLRENIELVKESDRKKVLELLDQEKTNLIDSKIQMFFGSGFEFPTYLNCFTSTSTETLKNEDTPDWLANRIKQERIRYFNYNGIFLGNDYSLYLDNAECKNIWPSTEEADKLENSRLKIKAAYDKAFFEHVESAQDLLREVESKNYLSKKTNVDEKLFTRNFTGIVTNAILDNNDNLESSPLMIINFNNIESTHIDHDIVHELNHLYELYVKFLSSNCYSVICGWDICEEYLDDTLESSNSKERDRREFELFSEIINELIAQDICKLMHEKNIFLFDDPKTSTFENVTSYEESLFLVKDFFDYFKKDIIESRKKGNIEHIWKVVGKENFYDLNELFKIFNDNFSNMRINYVLEDINKGKDNDRTRLYHDLEIRSKVIFERMKEHSKNYELEIGKEI